MLAFQLYSRQKETDDEEQEDSSMGMKTKSRKHLWKLLESQEIAVGTPQEFEAAISAIDKAFREHGLSEFMNTLTPGAQNAIYAASFVWGYENAIRQVKTAMKLEQVKNASDETQKSKAVIESMEKQAVSSDQPEKGRETASFVWGFYNEDMKESEAHSSKSETITEKPQSAKEELYVPATAAEAVLLAISGKFHNPALAYCVAAEQAAEHQKEQETAEQKKEQLARLVAVLPEEKQREKEIAEKAAAEQELRVLSDEKMAAKQQEKVKQTVQEVVQQKGIAAEQKEEAKIVEQERIAEPQKLSSGSKLEQQRINAAQAERDKLAEYAKVQSDTAQDSAVKVSEECVKIAVQRKDELVKEYVKVEKQLEISLAKLEEFSEGEKVAVKQICNSLPKGLAKLVMKREKRFSKREALRKQLAKWLVHCRSGRQYLLKLPLGKLVKLVSLSSLFKKS